ncbi:isorenieratene synthase [Mycolicibacterium chubuense]|uniref:15-cis-phytoene desaturase n=1 Tax=Mycolicibacterium chubuense TaxID=1800 RepID=A0A0J6YXH8_MYCCU|nr:FAD-dependent oxidoreductase [Mycolicibacterium chubuense]KMO77151.1 15-cis-phytoene desaturase [Mycolicibacterium chubuense]ORA50837.1 isorenieratene synthase [Mycolicibacterium chubuense]SPY00275.1 amine oxidase [Mycolicibacterium chubuense]
MTDPRRQTWPGHPGRSAVNGHGERPRVVVVGAGIAGLAAATGLAERGVAVDVVEQCDYLGGRVGGWTETLSDGSQTGMNRGFHAFFRQYYNLRALLRRADPALAALTPVEDYPLIDGAGRKDTFRGLPQTPPLNALAFALRSPTFRLRDLIRLDAKAAAPLATVSVPDTYRLLDDRDAARFLRDINFPDAARHLAFEVFARSFFARPEALSAGELVTMFHIYFLGSSEGLIFDVANANFDVALWDPLRDYLQGRGVTFHTGAAVDALADDGGLAVTTATDRLPADGVVLATDVAGLRRVVAASPWLGNAPWRGRVAGMGTAPPFVVLRLWLDRPVRADRAAFVGTGGREPLDNVSVVERYEREAAQWAARTGGSVVELHAYSVTDPLDTVRDGLIARMHDLYPETMDASIVDERLLHRGDCPRFAPGDFADRPTVRTPDPRIMLAGDGIRIDLPVALMERAATTGWAAANELLGRFGLAGHPLHTVPNQGRSALLRRLATTGGGAGR